MNSFTNIIGEVINTTRDDLTMPYEIRAEIDWVDFSCTANPLGTPECVRQAIAHAIAEGDLSFTPNRTGAHLATMLARYNEVDPGCFLVGTSPSAMISAVAQAYRPCNVAIPAPAPADYFLAVANVGHNPLKLINPFSLSAMDPQAAKNQGMSFDGAVLANPSMPCARLLNENTLKEYLDACNWVIIDESHITLALGGESFTRLTQRYKNLLVVRSLSEDFGLPGIPMGYIVGHPSTIEHIKQFSDGSTIGMFHEVLAKILPSLEEFTETTQAMLETEIPWMQCMLSLTPGVKVYPSEANYVMCCLEERAARDFGLATTGDLLVRLQRAGFTVGDLTGFPGIEGNRFFMVSIRSHKENERFIKALRSVITTEIM